MHDECLRGWKAKHTALEGKVDECLFLFESRISRRSDYEKVERLCRRSVGPRDYVLSKLDKVIDDGRLFLAFEGSELVGISHLTELPDKSGWLGMARTDPKWRGKGVARFLQRSIAAHEKKRGIKKLRMVIHVSNIPSVSAAKKGGFKPVCEVSYIYRRVKKVKEVSSAPSKPPISSLPKSKYIRMMNGYLSYDGYIMNGSPIVFKKVVDEDVVYMGNGTTLLFSKDDEYGGLTLLDGSPKKSLEKILAIGGQQGCSTVGGFIPYDSRLINSAKKLGFSQSRWGSHMLLFEKKI